MPKKGSHKNGQIVQKLMDHWRLALILSQWRCFVIYERDCRQVGGKDWKTSVKHRHTGMCGRKTTRSSCRNHFITLLVLVLLSDGTFGLEWPRYFESIYGLKDKKDQYFKMSPKMSTRTCVPIDGLLPGYTMGPGSQWCQKMAGLVYCWAANQVLEILGSFKTQNLTKGKRTEHEIGKVRVYLVVNLSLTSKKVCILAQET